MRSHVVDLRKERASPSSHGRTRLPLREAPKRETLRAKRRRRRLIVLIVLVVFLFGAGYGLSYASYLPQFSVQNVEVIGATDLGEETLREYATSFIFDGASGLFSRANVFLYPKNELESSLREDFPRIEIAEVSRESLLSTAVIVTIKERESFATWCSVGELETCYLMDRSGYIFALVGASSTTPVSPYTFRGGLSDGASHIGYTYLPGKLSPLIALLDRLAENGFTPREITTRDGDFFIKLAQGFELRASFGANIAELMRDLDLVLSSDSLKDKESQIEYIDLRFGNRVYYKLKGEQQQGAE